MDALTESLPESDVQEATASELEQIEALLTGAAEMPQAEAPETEAAEATPEKVEIDYELEVPMPDGAGPVKLGALKDFYNQAAQHKLAMIEAEQAVDKRRAEAETLLQYVDQMPPQIRQHVEQQYMADYEAGMKKLNELLPDTKTEPGRIALRNQLVALGAEYGVSEAVIGRIIDPITIKMMRDFAELKASIRAARDNVKPLRTEQQRPTANAKGATKPKGDKWAQIDTLLGVR